MSTANNLSRAVLSLLLLLAVSMLVQCSHTKYHHRCKVWKNKCELHKTHCPEEYPKDHILQSCCQPLLNNPSEFSSNDSGIYSIKLGAFASTLAWCDMSAGSGGWLMIMRRSSAEVNFNTRVMKEYEEGFGNLDGDFWFGLRTLATLTENQDYELRVDLYENANDTNSTAYANYGLFKISQPGYVLRIGEFSSHDNSGDEIHDGLGTFNNSAFQAKKTNKKVNNTCVLDFGGWWYAERCFGNNGSILTSQYHLLSWYTRFVKYNRSERKDFSRYEMKIRPKNCSAQLINTGNPTEST